MIKLYKILIYILPGVLFFSYYPLMSLGTNESMNFEFSLPLFWLVIFDLVSFAILVKRKLIKGIFKKWGWLLFPGFLSVSVLWSLNSLRGILTVGILWLIYFAIYSFYSLRGILKEFGVKKIFWKVFFGSSLVICVWCFVQCLLDLVGISRETSLMCAGCTYQMFGFPHPNGFAIEPQFMGNLLLAPTILVAYFCIVKFKKDVLRGWKYRLLLCALLFIFAATLFLTFSRGAIYSFVVAMIIMTVWRLIQTKKWKVLLVWPVIMLAFLFTLNLQGIMAEVSSTNDTYRSGVAKVLNHMSLGIIDIRERDDTNVNVENILGEEVDASDLEVGDEQGEAVFDGYVVESTATRKRLTSAALEVWQKDFKTMMFGVGLGGAGQALYINGLSPAPKEIIQNQYVSLLLETGLAGVALFILTIVMVIRVVIKNRAKDLIFTLMIAYGISVCFFAGLPNALHIYLLPAILTMLL